MTEPEMNVKLCSAQGWTEINDTLGFWRGVNPHGMLMPLPNHFSPTAEGLWACHQAENGLTDEQFETYARKLIIAAGRENTPTKQGRAVLSATAPQRALALYLTLCQ